MQENMTITAAKARLSELVTRLIHRNDTIFITRKGKAVAALIPMSEYRNLSKMNASSLLSAQGALAGFEEELDELVARVYRERDKEKDREVSL